MKRMLCLAGSAAALLSAVAVPAVAAGELPSVVARVASAATGASFDGVVEAVRQTVVAAQVSGAVVQLDVKAGDRVKAGQVLLRLDARAADQNAAASDAQVQAARASLDVAAKELGRQKQLFQQNYISPAALDRAESEFKATQAQVHAQLAQAGAARTQTGLHVVHAPYAGVVAEVAVALGDMAMPGRPLVTIYDPAVLRVTAAVPQTAAAQMAPGAALRIELPALAAPGPWFAPVRVQVLPTVDPSTHTVQLRAELPAGVEGAVPGGFARVWIGLRADAPASPMVPARAIVRRAELTAVYVVDSAGRPLLRQVRLGRVDGDSVEVLAGLTAGERVVTEPQAAARVR